MPKDSFGHGKNGEFFGELSHIAIGLSPEQEALMIKVRSKFKIGHFAAIIGNIGLEPICDQESQTISIEGDDSRLMQLLHDIRRYYSDWIMEVFVPKNRKSLRELLGIDEAVGLAI
jgi:hypothetical protein